ncbi:hypothetical protein [Pedobacter steynii]
MSKHEFIALYEKYKAGNCSQEEREFLENFKDDYVLDDYEWTPEMGNKTEIQDVLYARLKGRQGQLRVTSVSLTQLFVGYQWQLF